MLHSVSSLVVVDAALVLLLFEDGPDGECAPQRTTVPRLRRVGAGARVGAGGRRGHLDERQRQMLLGTFYTHLSEAVMWPYNLH